MGIILEKLKTYRFRSDRPNKANKAKSICFHHHGIQRIMYLEQNDQSVDEAYYRAGTFIGYPEKDECLRERIIQAVKNQME